MHPSQISLREDSIVNASFMVNEVVKLPAHVTKLRRQSGIANAMNLVPSKSITLPSIISPDEVLYPRKQSDKRGLHQSMAHLKAASFR